MLISIVFSAVIYRMVSNQIEGFISMQNDRIRRFQFQPPPNAPKNLEPPYFSTEDLRSQENQLIYTLVFINFGILIISGGAGYLLAGRTLHPIKLMIDEQNQFITDSSHELRTPIATLRAEMEGSLLEKNITDSQARKLITSNLEELGTLQTLTNNLLRLAQTHNGNFGNTTETCSIPDIISMAKKKVAALSKQKGITIKINVDDRMVKGDKKSLTEVFVILLDNAIKYSPNGTQIDVTSKSNNAVLKISICDQGIGISAKDLPHVFERFYRADKSRSQVEGYGLGLSIAKKIVEAHDGSIHAKNNRDKGSTFVVQLPVYLS